MFRYKEHMLSLDENGKMQVFGPIGKSGKEDGLTMLSTCTHDSNCRKTKLC
jgi:hypothetical protein